MLAVVARAIGAVRLLLAATWIHLLGAKEGGGGELPAAKTLQNPGLSEGRNKHQQEHSAHCLQESGHAASVASAEETGKWKSQSANQGGASRRFL